MEVPYITTGCQKLKINLLFNSLIIGTLIMHMNHPSMLARI